MSRYETEYRWTKASRSTHPSWKYPRRNRLFIAVLSFSLAIVAGVCLAQLGILSPLWPSSPSSAALTPFEGVVEDAQTGQPLPHAQITVQQERFTVVVTTDARGYFTLRVPRASQLLLSVPTYDPLSLSFSPGVPQTLTLTPDPSAMAQRSMNAFLQRRFDLLWSMLHPDAQAFWGSEAALTSFLTRKFGALPCLSYTVGQVTLVPTWIDPDTTQVYHHAAVLPVSLLLGATSGILTPPSEQAVTRGLFTHLEMAEVKSGLLWRVLVAGPLDLEAPLVVPAHAPAITARVPILMYHHVSARPTNNALEYSLTVTTPAFAAQMDYLAQHGYHPITLTDLFDTLYYGRVLPKKPIIISFDDGYEDNYTDAFPILQQQHFVAELNVITGLIGGSYLTWDQIRQMAASGMEISSHTIHHISLASALPQKAEHELLGSQTTLEQQLGVSIQFFCYPSGEPFHHGSQAQRTFITSLLYQDGYVGALLDPGVESVIQNPQLPYQLSRIRVAGGETLTGFIEQLAIQGVGPVNTGPGA